MEDDQPRISSKNQCTRILTSILLLTFLSCQPYTAESRKNNNEPASAMESSEWLRFRSTIDSLMPLLPAYTASHQLNKQWVIVAHLGVHSGLPRMVMLDIENKKIIDSGCVAHGYGSESFSEKAVFSNTPNSYCSSLGKYRVSNKYKGNFGWSYKLVGLENSNSNAYNRFIVLHAYDCIPDSIPYPDFICNSQGCPMVSYGYLNLLSNYIDGAEKPLLLWIVR